MEILINWGVSLFSFDLAFQVIPEGEFFKGIKAFSCFQIDLFAHLQFFGGTVIRVTGHHPFIPFCFDKTKREG
jgi:hypothetical protein